MICRAWWDPLWWCLAGNVWVGSVLTLWVLFSPPHEVSFLVKIKREGVIGTCSALMDFLKSSCRASPGQRQAHLSKHLRPPGIWYILLPGGDPSYRHKALHVILTPCCLLSYISQWWHYQEYYYFYFFKWFKKLNKGSDSIFYCLLTVWSLNHTPLALRYHIKTSW